MVEQSQPIEKKPRSNLDRWLSLAKNVLRRERDFSVDPTRAHEYYLLERYYEFHPDVHIPLGKYDSVHYFGEERGGTNDRDIFDYLIALFGDDYSGKKMSETLSDYMREHGIEAPHPDLFKVDFPKRDNAKSIFGGYDEVMKPGKTVLDLGPGQALGLMQFAEKHPETSFIGIDSLYQEKRKVRPGQPGLQLTHGNWNDLAPIPNNSIDTIISLQSLSFWGLPGFGGRRGVKPDDELTDRIVKSLYRVLKVGGTIRLDTLGEGDPVADYLTSRMDPRVWQFGTDSGIFLAKKIA